MSALSTPTAHPIDRLYRAAASDRLLIGVLAVAALASLLSLLLPQAPAPTAQESTARWLAETASRYGALGGVMQTLGLFDVSHSLVWRLLLAALTLIGLLRFGLAAEEAWSRLRAGDPARWLAQAQRWPLRAQVAADADAARVMAEAAEDLRNEGWRVIQPAAGAATPLMIAERSRAGVIAAPLFYLGMVAVLAGLWLGQWRGWRETAISLPPDQPVHLSHDSSLTLRAESGPAAGAETIWLQRDGGPALQKSFSFAGLLYGAGVWVRRTGAGQALTVTASSAAGDALSLQPVDRRSAAQTELTLSFDQPRAEQLFLVPAREVVFSVVAFPALPERGFDGPAFLVQAFAANQREPVTNQFVEGNAQLTVGDDLYSLSAGRTVTVEVSRRPGLPAAALGLLAMLAGAMLALRRPAGRLVLAVQPQRRTPELIAALRPSLFWRQAAQWLAVWASAYSLPAKDDVR